MKWIIPTIVLLIIGGAGFGVGWAVFEWRDDGGGASNKIESAESEPVEEVEPSMTATGAAIIAESFLHAKSGPLAFSACEPGEFDQDLSVWIVSCVCGDCYRGLLDDPSDDRDLNFRLSVGDRTSLARIISCTPPLLDE